MIELRPYQKEAKTAFLDYCREGRGNRGVVVFPTGCGKTIFGLSLAKDIGGRTLWLAHREELITQPMKALKAVWPGVNAGVVKAERNEWARDFVFASVQTAWRPERREKLKGFDLVVVDECHRAPAKSYKLVLEAQGCMAPDGPPLLGLTATPERTDNIRLDDVFQDIVYQFQLRQAVEDGYLVDVEMIQEGINVNLDNVGSSRGDFNEGELDLALLEANIVGEVCKTVSKHARRKKTIIFTVSVKQAVLISEELCKQGYAATYVSGETPTDQRRERLAGFATGKYTHCVNCMVLCLDEETEILTDYGWTGIDEMTEQHRVANWEDSGNVFFDNPREIVRRPRSPDESMYILETRSQSIRVTRRHRMIHRHQDASSWKKSPVDEITGKAHELPTYGFADPEIMEPVQPITPTQQEYDRLISANSYNLRKNNGLSMLGSVKEAKARLDHRLSLRRKRPDELTLDECRFIGFWIGDGSRADLSSGGVEYSVSQATVYPFIIKWFDSLISRIGFEFARRQRDWGIDHVRWGFGRGTGGGEQARRGVFAIELYLEKSGSPLFAGLSSSQFLALLEGFWYADGNHGQAKHGCPQKFSISNSNKCLLDQLQALAVVRGLSASVTKGKKPAKPNHQQVWNLYIQPGRVHRMSTAKEKYTIQKESEPWRPERVWCVKTTTKNIITRRNGRVTVMGNTEGFDEPTVDCIIMARPTQSKTLYIQCVGRGLRIAPGKDRCLIIDMVGVSGRHTLIQAPAIFGLEGQVDDTQTRTSPEEDGVTRHAQSLLLTQVQGTAPMARSRLRWVRAKGDVYALNCGEGGSVLMRPVGKEWLVEVIGRKDSAGREPLTMQPVDLELAQGIAEDYVRRASAVYLTSKSARWRDVPASEKQLQALRKWKIDFSDGITKGEASDLMTAAAAGSWRNEPATARQMRALRYRGVSFDEMTLTKGAAGRLLSK